MAAGFNRVMMVGNIADDPKFIESAKATILEMRIASENVSGSRAKGNVKIHQQYFTVKAYGEKAATMAPHCEKGRQLTILGELQNRSYEKDGQRRYVVEIVAERIIFGDDNRRRMAVDSDPAL